jgi:hypothetical protein
MGRSEKAEKTRKKNSPVEFCYLSCASFRAEATSVVVFSEQIKKSPPFEGGDEE